MGMGRLILEEWGSNEGEEGFGDDEERQEKLKINPMSHKPTRAPQSTQT